MSFLIVFNTTILIHIRFIERTPLPFRKAFLKQETQEEELSREKRLAEEPVNCTWTIQVGL